MTRALSYTQLVPQDVLVQALVLFTWFSMCFAVNASKRSGRRKGEKPTKSHSGPPPRRQRSLPKWLRRGPERWICKLACCWLVAPWGSPKLPLRTTLKLRPLSDAFDTPPERWGVPGARSQLETSKPSQNRARQLARRVDRTFISSRLPPGFSTNSLRLEVLLAPL